MRHTHKLFYILQVKTETVAIEIDCIPLRIFIKIINSLFLLYVLKAFIPMTIPYLNAGITLSANNSRCGWNQSVSRPSRCSNYRKACYLSILNSRFSDRGDGFTPHLLDDVSG
jgi:hypothetical protein